MHPNNTPVHQHQPLQPPLLLRQGLIPVYLAAHHLIGTCMMQQAGTTMTHSQNFTMTRAPNCSTTRQMQAGAHMMPPLEPIRLPLPPPNPKPPNPPPTLPPPNPRQPAHPHLNNLPMHPLLAVLLVCLRLVRTLQHPLLLPLFSPSLKPPPHLQNWPLLRLVFRHSRLPLLHFPTRLQRRQAPLPKPQPPLQPFLLRKSARPFLFLSRPQRSLQLKRRSYLGELKR
mmetsp:Transcript_19685/g.32273  ORF Transcript_19685/g.32273 Transcript_19685/m.32273 type:complete len:226 (-) Transcript_19685:1148-1825(-)